MCEQDWIPDEHATVCEDDGPGMRCWWGCGMVIHSFWLLCSTVYTPVMVNALQADDTPSLWLNDKGAKAAGQQINSHLDSVTPPLELKKSWGHLSREFSLATKSHTRSQCLHMLLFFLTREVSQPCTKRRFYAPHTPRTKLQFPLTCSLSRAAAVRGLQCALTTQPHVKIGRTQN